MNQDYDVLEDIANDVQKRNCPCNNDNMTREELMNDIKSYNFAIIELGEYLNTHPNDEKALCLHNNYCKTLRDLKDKYQKVYGPLSIYFPCNKWRWLEEPWASFILEEGFLSTKCNTIFRGILSFK